MLIRCDKCSTVYELDEKLLPAGGAPVQCSRCQYVFTAYPARGMAAAPGGTSAASRPAEAVVAASPEVVEKAAEAPPPAVASVGEPLPPPAALAPGVNGVLAHAPAVAAPGDSPADRVTPGPQTPVPTPAQPVARTADGRPIRKVPFPDEELVATPRPFPRPMVTPPARERTSSARLWLVVAAAVLVAGGIAAVVAWRLAARRSQPEAAQRRAEGQSLLLRDDRASLARAAVAFDDAARASPALYQARAEHAIARALALGHVRAEAERLAARADAVDPGADPSPVGPEDPARRAAQDEAARLRAQADAARAEARDLEAEIAAELAPLARERPKDPVVLRAVAVLAAFGSDASRAGEAVRRARAAGPRDAWVDLADAAAGVRAGSSERRAEAAARAEVLARTRPDLLRARIVLATALGRAGQLAEASAVLDGVLAANPAHEDARAMKAALAPAPARAAPPAEPPPPPRDDAIPRNEPGNEPPADTPGILPRKTLSHADAEAPG